MADASVNTAARRVQNWIEMLDVDGDSAVDVLLSNGDTTEFRSNPRQYHGIRIYDLVGNGLAEKQFIPAHGVMDFVMPDTGAEGDLDIASVSHFADFRHQSHQAAIDGDGDPDLLLGSLNYQTYTRDYEKDASYLRSVEVPRTSLARWERVGNHLSVLENLAKRAR